MKCKDEPHYIKLNSIGNNRIMQWSYGIVEMIDRLRNHALVSQAGY